MPPRSACMLIFSIFFVPERKTKSLSLLLFPVGVLLITAMMLRAGYQCVKNGGIDWRGTHYPSTNYGPVNA